MAHPIINGGIPRVNPLSHPPRGMTFRPSQHATTGIRTFYVSSDSGAEYVVQRIRRSGMNRWQCSCPQFFFRCVSRRRHIRAVRAGA
jgi:hypothetical protein